MENCGTVVPQFFFQLLNQLRYFLRSFDTTPGARVGTFSAVRPAPSVAMRFAKGRRVWVGGGVRPRWWCSWLGGGALRRRSVVGLAFVFPLRAGAGPPGPSRVAFRRLLWLGSFIGNSTAPRVPRAFGSARLVCGYFGRLLLGGPIIVCRVLSPSSLRPFGSPRLRCPPSLARGPLRPAVPRIVGAPLAPSRAQGP